MARIKIKDLPKDMKISRDDMRKVIGGGVYAAPISMDTGGDSAATEMDATQQMDPSFNLQYLQLQQKMQADNRQFTLMSNIMKTKHDTAKNAINNVR